jgi:hypothetical protein
VVVPSPEFVERRHTMTDRRHTVVVAEDAQRIAHLARELQRNALELEGQSHSLRGTVQALEEANEELDRRTSEIAAARAGADAATARLTRLQRITAALSNTVTQDGVCETVLREAILALECEAGAVVVAADAHDTCTLLREAGPLDPLLRSFETPPAPTTIARGPYVDAAINGVPVYLESFEEMSARYPAFRRISPLPSHGSLGAWIFLPLDIGGRRWGRWPSASTARASSRGSTGTSPRPCRGTVPRRSTACGCGPPPRPRSPMPTTPGWWPSTRTTRRRCSCAP